MFKRLNPDSAAEVPIVTIEFDGKAITARRGDSVAAALLGAGVTRFRKSAISGAERGPYCLMGVCFDCLVEIDGIANQQACMRVVEDGMRVARQNGAVALNHSSITRGITR